MAVLLKSTDANVRCSALQVLAELGPAAAAFAPEVAALVHDEAMAATGHNAKYRVENNRLGDLTPGLTGGHTYKLEDKPNVSVRPTVGSEVEVLDTDLNWSQCPRLVGRTVVITLDDGTSNPYHVESGGAAWLTEGDVRQVDRHVGEITKWGSVVRGIETGNGMLFTDSGTFLPMVLRGVPVIVPLEARLRVSDVAKDTLSKLGEAGARFLRQ